MGMEVSVDRQTNTIKIDTKENDGQWLASCTVNGVLTLLHEKDSEEKLEITCELRHHEKMDWLQFVCDILPYVVISVITIVVGCCFSGKQHDADGKKDCDVIRVQNVEASTSVRIGAEKAK